MLPPHLSRCRLPTQFPKSTTEARHTLGGGQLPGDHRTEAHESRSPQKPRPSCTGQSVPQRPQGPVRVTQVGGTASAVAQGLGALFSMKDGACVSGSVPGQRGKTTRGHSSSVLSPGQEHSPRHAPASSTSPSAAGARGQLAFLPGCALTQYQSLFQHSVSHGPSPGLARSNPVLAR